MKMLGLQYVFYKVMTILLLLISIQLLCETNAFLPLHKYQPSNYCFARELMNIGFFFVQI